MQFKLRLFSTLAVGVQSVQRQAVTQHEIPFDAATLEKFSKGDPTAVQLVNKSASGQQSNLAAGPPHCWPHQSCSNGDCCTWGTSCNTCPNSYYGETSGFWGGWGCFWKGAHRCHGAKSVGHQCHSGNQCGSGVCKGYRCCGGNDATCTSCNGNGQCDGCVSGYWLNGATCVKNTESPTAAPTPAPVLGVWTVTRGVSKWSQIKTNEFCGKDTDTFSIGEASSNHCQTNHGSKALVVVDQDGFAKSDGWYCAGQVVTEVQGHPTFDASRGTECENTHHIADDGL